MKQRNTRKIRRKPMRGGAKIGEGSDAIVYYPAIPCIGKNTSDYVSKVFETKEKFMIAKSKLEKVLPKLAQIDPEQKYFLYPIFCERIGELTKENKADGITNESKKYSYLVKKGGKSLAPILAFSGLSTYDKKIEFLTPIVKEAFGMLDILNENGIVHGDFHTGNMLKMPDDSYRIIDFDSSFVYDPDKIKKMPEDSRERMKVEDAIDDDTNNFVESACQTLGMMEPEIESAMDKFLV